jgi:hypothetical protein
MQAQLDQWRQQKDASEGQSIEHRQEHGQRLEHFALDDARFCNIVPVSPLSVELESALWPCRFNVNTLPQYDGDYDLKEFLMKFEAAVESNGGDATTRAKAPVMALKGEVQYWYANIPKGHITSWFQLRNKLLSSFKGMQVEELDSEGPKRRTREGGSEWEPIKILLKGDRGSNKMNTASNTRLRLNYQSWPRPRIHWSATGPRNQLPPSRTRERSGTPT